MPSSVGSPLFNNIMHSSVSCIANTVSQADLFLNNLRARNFRPDDLSVLFLDKQTTTHIANEKPTKAPEGASTSVAIGGILGWLPVVDDASAVVAAPVYAIAADRSKGFDSAKAPLLRGHDVATKQDVATQAAMPCATVCSPTTSACSSTI